MSVSLKKKVSLKTFLASDVNSSSFSLPE